MAPFRSALLDTWCPDHRGLWLLGGTASLYTDSFLPHAPATVLGRGLPGTKEGSWPLMNEGFNEPGYNLRPVNIWTWNRNLFSSPVDHFDCVPRGLSTKQPVSSVLINCLSPSLHVLTQHTPPHLGLLRSPPKQTSSDTNSCLWA